MWHRRLREHAPTVARLAAHATIALVVAAGCRADRHSSSAAIPDASASVAMAAPDAARRALPDPASPDAGLPPATYPITSADLGGRPRLLGSVGRLTFGMTMAQAHRAAPDLVPARSTDDPVSVPSPWPSVWLRLFFENDRLAQVQFEIEHAQGRPFGPVLDAAWGTGQSTPRGGTFWLDPDARVQANLDSAGSEYLLWIGPYLPAAEVLDRDDGTFGPLVPAVGMTEREVRRRWGEPSPSFNAPPTFAYKFMPSELASRPSNIWATIKGGRVTCVAVWLWTSGSPAEATRLLALVEAGWGRASRIHTSNPVATAYAAPGLEIVVDIEAFQVTHCEDARSDDENVP